MITSYNTQNQDKEKIAPKKTIKISIKAIHSPILRRSIINNLSKYYNNIQNIDNQLMNTDNEEEGRRIQTQLIIVSQIMIGWEHFIRKRISTVFSSQIKKYYK